MTTTADVLAAAQQHGFYPICEGGTKALFANEAYIVAHAPRTTIRIPCCVHCEQPFVVPATQRNKVYCSERCYLRAKAQGRSQHA